MGSLSIQAGGKVPLPGTHANAPPGSVRAASTGKASGGLQHHLRGAQIRPQHHLRGAQQARSAPRTNVRELFCGSKITRNDSDEAERRERSPPGVVSAANDEGLAGAARQVRGASPAREWECFASQREFRGERGGPEGEWPSGAIRIRRNNQFVACNDTERQTKLMSKCMTTRDLTSDGIGPDK